MLVFVDVAASVVHLVSAEVLGGAVPSVARPVATIGKVTVVAVVGVEVIIYVAAELAGAMKPGASAEEDTAGEPLGPVVAVGSATVGRGFVVSIRAGWGGSDVDADLRFGSGSICCEAQAGGNG